MNMQKTKLATQDRTGIAAFAKETHQGGSQMKHSFETFAMEWLEHSVLNQATLETSGETIALYEPPLFGYASAEDECFDAFQQPSVIGPHFRKPQEWLPGAKTVISFFLPFAEAVRQSNRVQQAVPGEAWLYGRVEGQRCMAAFTQALEEELQTRGYGAVAPSCSASFWSVSEPEEEGGLSYTSNWSERHVAYACGLGTFGLSKGLITEKGMAGRLGSIVTDWQTTPTPRTYTEVYEHCIRCGVCAQRCPGGAISPDGGKDHRRCLQYQQEHIMPHTAPRFGCGLCQTGVPCEACKP